MVGQAVKYVSTDGTERDALVLHEYPHDANTETPDARRVILAAVDTDARNVGPFGRVVRVLESVPHRQAQFTPPADAPASVLAAGCWHELGE